MDPRSLTDTELLEAVSNHQPLALTEAYHRTVSAAHAVVRRLLNDSDKIEEVLTRVYSRLWAERPTGVPLEGWARATTWDIGTEVLRREQLAPISPSVGDQLPDLPAPDARFVDTAERAINELDDAQRTALLQSHDQGIATVEQEDGRAGELLVNALITLAGGDPGEQADPALIRKYPGIADWAMGTASPTTMQVIETALEDDADLAELSRTLRRGRRRIEGLPATPDMGARILVSILAASSDAEATLRPEPLVPGTDAVDLTPAEGDAEPEHSPDLHMVADDLGYDESVVDGEEEVMPTLTVVPATDSEPLLEDVSPITEDDNLEGGLLTDDPYGDDPSAVAQDWVPRAGDTSEMRLRDVIEGTVEDDEDPFGDDDVAPYADERMPRTAQSGRISAEPLGSEYDEPFVQPDQVAIGFDDPNAATTQFQAIGQGSEETLYDDADTPYEESTNPVVKALAPLLANQAVREWVLPLIGGAIIGWLLAFMIIG